MSLRIKKLFRRTFLCRNIVRSYKKDTSTNEIENVNSLLQTSGALPQQIKPEISRNYEAIRSNAALLPSQIKRKEIDELNYAIRTAIDSNDLFSVYLQNRNLYDIQQYLLTIERLAEIFKDGKISSESLHQNIAFESLCYEIWKITSQLESWMVIHLYRDLLNLKVSTNFLIMQSLLQMMRNQINLLSIKQLLFLHALLKQTDDCILKKALQMAIPKVIENCINVHFPVKLKFSEATQLLNICVSGEVKCFWRVLNHFYKTSLPELLSTVEKPAAYNPYLISLVSNICDLICNENILLLEKDIQISYKLITNCFIKLVESEMDGAPQGLILALLRKLGNSYLHERGRFVYHERFLSAVVHKALVEEWNVNSLCKIIEYQLKLYYVNDKLVQHVASCITNQPDIISEMNVSIPPLLSAFSCSNIPHEYDHVTSLLMKDYSYPIDNIAIPWIRFALDCFALNYVPYKLLEAFTNEEFLSRYFLSRTNRLREVKDFLRMESVLKMKNLKIEMALPKQFRSMGLELTSGPRPELHLKSALRFLIGSPQCLATNVFTPNRNVIDHLLVVDKDGNPRQYLSDESNSESVEVVDLHLPAEDRKIAIMEIPYYWTHRPGTKLRGLFKMELKFIEREGFDVLPLHETEIDFNEPAKVIVYVRQMLQSIGVKLR